MSNFSFSHSVFKRFFSQGCQKVLLWENRLTTLKKKAYLKPLWEKEKMLVTSIFSFSHLKCFLPHENNIIISHIILFHHLQMVSIWLSPKFCGLVKG